jgi:drug/metabolite transporter (DMT)-like permease
MTELFSSFGGEFFALAAAVSWALAVILFKKSGEKVHPLALSLFKSTLALVLFFLTMVVANEPIFRQIPTDHYVLFIASGIIGIGICDTIFFMSLNIIGAGLSAVVGCLYSPSIITMSVLFLNESLTQVQIIGAILIVSGVASSTRARVPGNVPRRRMLYGIFLGVLSIVANAVGIVMVKPLLDTYPILWVTETRLIGGVASLAILFLAWKDRDRVLRTLLSGNHRYTLSGSIAGAYFAMIFWLAGMKFTQASTASVLNQTSNIFVFGLAALFLREPITRIRLLAIGLGVTGVLMVTLGRFPVR